MKASSRGSTARLSHQVGTPPVNPQRFAVQQLDERAGEEALPAG
jgi:hypothetical protein